MGKTNGTALKNATDSLYRELQRVRIDFRKPYLLDTEQKVEWANRLLSHMSMTERAQWRLGDHCWYQPR